MLTHIQIRDYTIVDKLELDFSPGMTAMTGETGAGKSILIDAMGLALGDRGDTGVIRAGAQNAEIILSFDLSSCPPAIEWLQQQDLESDQDCIIRRTLSHEGNSKGFINGRPVPMRSLKELGEMLVDIHGQHQHQSLVKKDIQRQLVDDYAGNQKLAQQLSGLYNDWKKTSTQLERLRAANESSAARLELLKFQVEELDQLALQENEYEELNQEYDRLANAGQIMENCQKSLQALFENEEAPIYAQLNQVSQWLEPLGELDKELQSSYSLVTEASIQLREAADDLRHYLDRLDLDPERMDWVNQRLTVIHDLARKHKVSPEQLPELQQQLSEELYNLDHSDEALEKLQARLDELEKDYQEIADEVSHNRQQAATKLNEEVTSIIHDLGMPHAQFAANLEPVVNDAMTAYGNESIEFLVATNPGQPLKPLSKIASGGELSRISLAIQVILAQNTRINTLVYDEVDTGIGGPTAEIVGRLLRRLGKARQVMCVTHLPQVAAQAHNHLQVKKQSDKSNTVTGIKPLTDNDRVEEIARMLGGVKMTDQSRAHAKELLDIGSE